ncbi:hypothetical protein B0H14DRAFT_3570535 [Mycena olivaceomarginata]|nr:hypothetical protein B0H14DRAFT_3570535 [Mycena olivaceomarginata]
MSGSDISMRSPRHAPKRRSRSGLIPSSTFPLPDTDGTQIRASFKPTTDKDTKVTTYAPDSEHQNIFQLTSAVVKGSQCPVIITLCSRVALMRKVFLKHPGPNFWDKLDFKLEEIHNKAGVDSKKLVRGFRHILEQDQEKHGQKTYTDSDIPDRVDDFQQQVNNIIYIDIGSIDVATSAQDQPSAA